MAQQIESVNKYEFYNKFIQFLYPTLVIYFDNIGNNNNDEVEEKECDIDDKFNDKQKYCDLLLYNSSIFSLNVNYNEEDINSLITDLRDQGSEYFDKLLIMTQNSNNNKNNDNNKQELIKKLCNKITINSKTLKTFYIFNDDNNVFMNKYKILTINWYNIFCNKYNTNNCIGYPSLPSMIENNLFVGGIITAQNLFILKSLNISIIINCTKNCKNYFESDNIIYHRINIDDKENENITLHLKQCYKLLNEYIDNKNLSVLVHCERGRSRSISMIIYYLMQKYKFSVEHSLKYIKNLRQIASPNKGFIHQLQQLQ